MKLDYEEKLENLRAEHWREINRVQQKHRSEVGSTGCRGETSAIQSDLCACRCA